MANQEMTDQERARKLLLDSYEQTLQGRAKFEELDHQATESAVRIMKVAADLAERAPQEFFGAGSAQAGRGAAGAQQIDPDNPGGAQHPIIEVIAGLVNLIGSLEGVMDFIKSEKEYWGKRDDKGAEGTSEQANGH